MSLSSAAITRLRVGACVGFIVLAVAVALPVPALLAQSTPVASPAAFGAIDVTGLVQHAGQLTVADLQTLPSETVDVTFESGGEPQNHTYTGVRLIDVIDDLGLAVEPRCPQPAAAHVPGGDGH